MTRSVGCLSRGPGIRTSRLRLFGGLEFGVSGIGALGFTVLGFRVLGVKACWDVDLRGKQCHAQVMRGPSGCSSCADVGEAGAASVQFSV